MTLSTDFIAALATSSIPAYRLARRVGMSAPSLSRKVRGRRSILPEDRRRLLEIGRILGLPAGRVFADSARAPRRRSSRRRRT